jgi:uncharacterized membrane protein
MRWKLLIIASLTAAIVGTGAAAAAARFLAGAGDASDRPGAAAAAGLLAPLVSITFASIFVYRHTARRRSVQAMATALLAAVLTLAALLAGSLLWGGRTLETAPTQTPAAGNL